MRKFDVVIVGSGLAGLTVALSLPKTVSVAILTKKSLDDSSSSWAQGGIAAVFDKADSFESHLNDTVKVGSGLTNRFVARQIIDKGKDSINWLIEQGVKFSKINGGANDFHLNREAGHSNRRVVHAADHTGKTIQCTLRERIQERANITVLENKAVIDIITGDKVDKPKNCVCGVYALDTELKEVAAISSGVVVLATGGASKVYLYTTNPDTATGDGIAMAWRAGCTIADMEFIQFHPTCLFHPNAKSFLISEAVRGEGGKLVLPNGNRFMQHHDERAELAPRDIVARAIDHEMKKLGIDCVFLDISEKSKEFLYTHFPNITQRCMSLGIDISKDPIPVVPAAHYTCGGIKIDLNGSTEIDGLYAVGETAHSGLHGANRLASNSLLECLVIGRNVSSHIESKKIFPAPNIPDWDNSLVIDPDEEIVISHNWQELRRFMWDYVGIVRTNKRLERALNRLVLLKKEINEYYSKYKITANFIELRNLVQTAELIVKSAQLRRECRGLHFSTDYLEVRNKAESTILRKNRT